MQDFKHTNWYKDVVFYQIYPRSFCDSNKDGIGDIQGIISKLDYLKDLGIGAIWLSPVYDSPQYDNGYDIANYRDIWKPFGTMDDMKQLIKECHKRDIKLVMDLVVNHTSNEHAWFKSAISDPNSPYRDYYIIKKGKNNGKKPPNNWDSCFGGSAWTRIGDSDEYYLHLFAKEQPDLNWENPKVRKEVVDILRFWMDLGIDGFRCDVITLISKDQRYKNDSSMVLRGKKYYVNGPLLHEYLKMLYEHAYKDYDVTTIGETMMGKLKDIKQLVNPEHKELDMAFNFSHTDVDNYLGVKYLYRKFKLTRFKKRLAESQYALASINAWNTLFIENHDQRRSAGRFGTDLEKYRVKSAKSLATSYFLLQGTPFIYQGQEIGMQNMDYTSIADFKDVEVNNMYKTVQESKLLKKIMGKHLFDTSRDNARTPMQWDNSYYAGFSEVEPWLKVNANKNIINVKDSLNDSDSILNYYKKLIKIKKKYDVVRDGEFKLLYPHNNKLFIYTRENQKHIMLVIASFSKKNAKNVMKNKLKGYELLLSNDPHNDLDVIHPYEARVYLKSKVQVVINKRIQDK
ncbi:MAG: alpha-glucosidase [Bacilli bacterium]|nr:alpha-glucosidase [Bacilli bacterium]